MKLQAGEPVAYKFDDLKFHDRDPTGFASAKATVLAELAGVRRLTGEKPPTLRELDLHYDHPVWLHNHTAA